MLITTDYFTPAELSGYARASLGDIPVNQPSLARWLPNRVVPDLTFRFTRGGEGLTEAATFRSWDTEAPIGSRPGFTRVTGELPPISRKMRQDEYTRLRARAGGADQLRNLLLTDTERLVRAIAMRIELARGAALVGGAVTINENGVVATVDFGRAGGNTVAPSTLWTDLAASLPFKDLRTWCDAYEDVNGERPGAIVTSSRVLSLMLENQAVRTLAGTVLGTPGEVTRGQLDNMLQTRDLPPIYTYNVKVRVNGAAQRVIADDKVLLLPPPTDPNNEAGTDLGATLWGTTAESMEPNYALQDADQPGVVAGNYTTQDPVALWTKAAGVSLPVLVNPDLSMCADVA